MSEIRKVLQRIQEGLRVVGISDEITTCQKCGKSDLKRTVVMKDDSGEVVYWGSDCAANKAYGNKSAANKERILLKAKVAQIVHGPGVTMTELRRAGFDVRVAPSGFGVEIGWGTKSDTVFMNGHMRTVKSINWKPLKDVLQLGNS